MTHSFGLRCAHDFARSRVGACPSRTAPARLAPCPARSARFKQAPAARHADDPLTACARAPAGLGSVYRDTGLTSSGFKDSCGVDHDVAGVPAAVACPVSCGTCGLGTCYEGSVFKKCRLSTYSTDSDADAAAV